jgi:hypothetical protein
MGSWHIRASAASITGACVFAVVTGAGAVFVGDWWGSSHHSTVVTQFVTAPASPAHGSHPAVTRSARPAPAGHHTSGGPGRSQVQADAQTAQVARSAPAAPAHPAHQTGAGKGPDNPGQGNDQGSGQDGNGGQGQDQGGPDPTSAPATPTASASTPAPAATPTAGTAGGDQG